MVSSIWPGQQIRAGAGKGMDLYDGAGVNQFLLSGLAADVAALHCAVDPCAVGCSEDRFSIPKRLSCVCVCMCVGVCVL